MGEPCSAARRNIQRDKPVCSCGCLTVRVNCSKHARGAHLTILLWVRAQWSLRYPHISSLAPPFPSHSHSAPATAGSWNIWHTLPQSHRAPCGLCLTLFPQKSWLSSLPPSAPGWNVTWLLFKNSNPYLFELHNVLKAIKWKLGFKPTVHTQPLISSAFHASVCGSFLKLIKCMAVYAWLQWLFLIVQRLFTCLLIQSIDTQSRKGRIAMSEFELKTEVCLLSFLVLLLASGRIPRTASAMTSFQITWGSASLMNLPWKLSGLFNEPLYGGLPGELSL